MPICSDTDQAVMLEDAIAHVRYATDEKQGNTIVPSRRFTKLRDPGLNSHLCAWVLDVLIGSTQVVRVGRCVSNSITINTGAPQGCVLSPLLCVATHGSNSLLTTQWCWAPSSTTMRRPTWMK